MATSDGNGIDVCLLHRGRSQSDPNLLTESGIDLVHSTVEVMDHQRVLHTGCLVSGVHTPPIRRNSKLASLGRIFKPWKWRKKKNEKLKQSSTDVALSSGCISPEPGSPLQGSSDGTGMLGSFGGSLSATLTVSSVEYLGPEEELPPPAAEPPEDCEPEEESSQKTEEEGEEEAQPSADASDEVQEGIEETEERLEEEIPRGTTPPPVAAKPVMPQLSSGEDPSPVSSHLANSFLPKEPPRAPESLASMVSLRGPLSNSSGSPHLTNIMHPPMPPSCIMEELQRAFASKANRQESVHGPAEPCSPPWRRSDGRISRSSSSENPSVAGGGVVDWLHQTERKMEAEENKENVRLDQCFSDSSGLPHDQDDWNDSVISGTLPRRLRKELLTVKLRNRPSKEELEDRNIFPARTEQERQDIRQQIEMKLAKRLSQRPNVEELESRNILKQRNDQTEQEERREIKQRLNRKLNQRPTVDELRDRKILIRFSDYVEVAKAQDYDRRADKPWTRLSAADKAAIRKELNEFKSTEMEVHASSKHLTRFHRP
ncbi:phosphatase and actin regulator 3-like isoform X1 [Salvelinus fontinalis]|uniref:phosphatase and actin regulator 3-like isoform X1 n=1 Tax=Salvelinus fontinalis TaxID=8038 RepID=UPI00248698AE|nr:phosphatase and actin regulator 3-like isoform X1 [Salvelinus fontinalis]